MADPMADLSAFHCTTGVPVALDRSVDEALTAAGRASSGSGSGSGSRGNTTAAGTAGEAAAALADLMEPTLGRRTRVEAVGAGRVRGMRGGGGGGEISRHLRRHHRFRIGVGHGGLRASRRGVGRRRRSKRSWRLRPPPPNQPPPGAAAATASSCPPTTRTTDTRMRKVQPWWVVSERCDTVWAPARGWTGT